MTMLAAAVISLAVLFAPAEQNQTPIAGCQSPAAEDALAQPTEPLLLSGGYPCSCCDRDYQNCASGCQGPGSIQCLRDCEQDWNWCMVSCESGVPCDCPTPWDPC